MSDRMLMDATWERIQKKTFTGWVNNHLKKRGSSIEDLESGFKDGLMLIKLLEIIADETFPFKFDKKPKIRIQMVGNVGFALRFIADKGVKLAGTGPEEIVDGNIKMILGMVWTIILRFQIQDISLEEMSAKEALLLWCQRKTEGYEKCGTSGITNFHFSFKDGKAFCALIHKHRPDLIEWEPTASARDNLERAFAVAENDLDIPRLLDVDDMVDVPKPDERSVMTYVSLYYHKFAAGQQKENAGERIGKLVDFAKEIAREKEQYISRATDLVEWICNKTADLQEREFDNTLEGVEGKLQDFTSYRKDEKPPKETEKLELEASFNSLNTKLQLNNRDLFVPPEGYGPRDIDALWRDLEREEHERRIALQEELRRQRKIRDLLRRFNKIHARLSSYATSKADFLESDSIGADLTTVRAQLKNHDAFEGEFEAQSKRQNELDSILEQLRAVNFPSIEEPEQKRTDLSGQWSTLEGVAQARKTKLEEELARLQAQEDMLLNFAMKALQLDIYCDDVDDEVTDPYTVDTVAAANELQEAFDKRVAEFDERQAEFDETVALAGQITDAGLEETTFSQVSSAQLQEKWANVRQLIDARRAELEAEVSTQEANDELRQQFATAADEFNTWVSEQNDAIANVAGTPEEQLSAVDEITHSIAEKKPQYDNCVSLTHQLDAAGVTDNPHTNVTIEGLKRDYEALSVLTTAKSEALRTEVAAANTKTSLTPEQQKEFRETFDHFDKDKSGHLDRLEFGSALTAIGEDVDFDAGGSLDKIMKELDTDNDGNVSFDEFLGYMEKQLAFADSPDQIKDSFKVLAGDKDYVTENDLQSVMAPEQVEYLLSQMPPYEGVEGGYDFKKWTESVYA